MMVMYSPDVIGRNGGISHGEFIRENGDRLYLDMPWGEELLCYRRGERNPVISKFSTINPIMSTEVKQQ